MVYILPLIVGVLWGLASILNKKSSKYKFHPLVSGFIYNLASGITTIPLMLIFGIQYTTSLIPWIANVTSSLITAFGFWMYYKALEKAPLTIVTMISRFSIVVGVVGGIMIFGEVLKPLQILGFIIMFVGMILPGIKDIKQIWNKGSLYSLLTGIVFGISALIDKKYSVEFSSAFYIFFQYICVCIFLFSLLAITKNIHKIKELNVQNIWGIFIGGGMNAIGFFAYILSFTLGGGIGIGLLLTQIRMPLVLLGGIFLLKERENNLLKIIGSILIIGGTILLKI